MHTTNKPLLELFATVNDELTAITKQIKTLNVSNEELEDYTQIANKLIRQLDHTVEQLEMLRKD